MEKKILICDNNQGLVQVLKTILSEFTPANILTETCIKDVYVRVLREQPDVLIADLGMPNIKADRLMHDIRNDADCEGIYIIAISASAQGMRLSLAAGADVSLGKPLDLDELMTEVILALL
ncbi:response regulator [Sphingobacterium yanglingense]|nr:response regulator [Sphingobacterium yanglingense]